MKIKAKWVCQFCAYKHSWTWSNWDVITGPIDMHCDGCDRVSRLRMRKTGDVTKKGRPIWRAE